MVDQVLFLEEEEFLQGEVVEEVPQTKAVVFQALQVKEVEEEEDLLQVEVALVGVGLRVAQHLAMEAVEGGLECPMHLRVHVPGFEVAGFLFQAL